LANKVKGRACSVLPVCGIRLTFDAEQPLRQLA